MATQRMVFIISDTGGGHRASASAVRESYLQLDPNIHIDIIDVFRQYAPFPYRGFPAIYPILVANNPEQVWRNLFVLSNGQQRIRWLTNFSHPIMMRSMRRFLREHPADLYVCFHSLLLRPVLRALPAQRPPFWTVVTDLVSIHASWFHRRADFTIVPTQAAFEVGCKNGVSAERLKVIGLPVSPRFREDASYSLMEQREQLGWVTDLPTFLLVGGGDGMGNLAALARAIAALPDSFQLVVVCGRNESVRGELSQQVWQRPMQIYGFVDNMPDLMRAADVVITKSGPSSIMEALNCGKPLILSSAIAGQEEGNVAYVVESGAGIWAPTPAKVSEAVTGCLRGQYDLAVLARNARAAAQPHAASLIAQEMHRYLMSRAFE